MAAERDRHKAPGNRIRLTGQLVRPEPIAAIVGSLRATLGAPGGAEHAPRPPRRAPRHYRTDLDRPAALLHFACETPVRVSARARCSISTRVRQQRLSTAPDSSLTSLAGLRAPYSRRPQITALELAVGASGLDLLFALCRVPTPTQCCAFSGRGIITDRRDCGQVASPSGWSNRSAWGTSVGTVTRGCLLPEDDSESALWRTARSVAEVRAQSCSSWVAPARNQGRPRCWAT